MSIGTALAQHSIDGGAPLSHVQLQLGHTFLQTTVIYAGDLSFDQKMEAHQRYHPRRRNRSNERAAATRMRANCNISTPSLNALPEGPTMIDDGNSIQNDIEHFLTEAIVNSNTRKKYRCPLKDFACWVAREKASSLIEGLGSLEYQDIEEYLTHLALSGASFSTLTRARSAIASLFDYLGRKGRVLDNPTEDIESIKRHKHIRMVPSVDEVNEVLDSIGDRNPFWPSRDQAIFELCYEGLAESDLVALDTSDIDRKQKSALRHSDGKRIPLGPFALKSLQIWLDERAARLARKKLASNSTPALFIGFTLKGIKDPNSGARIDPHTVFSVIKRIRQDWNARLLRDACGVHMLDEGASPLIVAAQLGVEISAIDRLMELATKQRGEKVQSTHPRARLPKIDEPDRASGL